MKRAVLPAFLLLALAVPGIGQRGGSAVRTAPPSRVKSPAAAATYTNPTIDRDLPDPGALWAEGAYWMVHTTGGPGTGWPIYRSPDMVHWSFVRHLLDTNPAPGALNNKPAWMKSEFWAPEIHQVGRGYVLTFTARSHETNRLCVGIATAASITGPYTVQTSPIVSDSVAVLDSHIFQDADGAKYLLWKRDADRGGGVGGAIFLRRMNAFCTAFLPNSPPIKLLEGSTATTDPAAVWERGLVEAPWMLRRGRFYYLFYSGAFIDTSYALGVARSPSPTGPFVRCPGNPILRSNAVWGGPGHGAFLQDATGTIWHLYHARHQDGSRRGRVQMLDRLYWNGDWPAFGEGGTPSATPQPAPQMRQPLSPARAGGSTPRR